MKNFTMQLTIAAAALAAVAGSASAQTYKAEIPMAFHAGSKAMAAGSYDVVVRNTSGSAIITVRSAAAHETAILAPFPGSDAPESWKQNGNPKISFECLDGACSLRSFWNGLSNSVYSFPARKLAPAEKERLAVVTVGLTKAD
jgi:hypothetical protein